MNIAKIPIDVKKLLANALLVDVVPVAEYKDGRKTDTISGFRYVCVLPDIAYERISVKISGSKPLIEVADSAMAVTFTDPVAKIYSINGSCDISISATGISRVGNGDGKR